MTFVVVPDKAAGDLYTEAMWDTFLRDNLNKGVVRPIAEATLTGAAASIEFASIAADWSHLQLVLYGRGDAAAAAIECWLRFNGDTAVNYDNQNVTGNAAAASAGEDFALSRIIVGNLPGGNAPGAIYGMSIIDIPHYAQAVNQKTVNVRNSHKAGIATGNIVATLRAGFWRNIGAVGTITLLPSSGNFLAGTRATLYGMGGI